MKSIEERAEQYADGFKNVDGSIFAEIMTKPIKKSYIIGAKEQRDLDIQKAAEWWESRCDYLGISKYQIELFKKAMEEQS